MARELAAELIGEFAAEIVAVLHAAVRGGLHRGAFLRHHEREQRFEDVRALGIGLGEVEVVVVLDAELDQIFEPDGGRGRWKRQREQHAGHARKRAS